MTDFAYAIGDIHGQLEHLLKLYMAIREHSNAHEEGRRTVIHLGDYIDRGPDSKEVIETLMAGFEGFEAVYLKGNHEEMMVNACERPNRSTKNLWLRNGGNKTIDSYETDGEPAVIPRAHIEWLKGLKTHHREGPFFFVHAGIDPKRNLDDQNSATMLWTRRRRFLKRDPDVDYRVIHGHTPTSKGTVEIKKSRINVDTGCFVTGILTACVLDLDGPVDQKPELIQVTCDEL